MENILAALATLPHWVAALFSCTIFAANCTLAEPLIVTPLTPERSHTAELAVATPSAPLTPLAPAGPTRPRQPLLPNTGDVQVSTSSSQNISTVVSSNASHRSGNTTVTTSINGETKTVSLPSNSGVSNTLISITENGQTRTYATTTALPEAESARMQEALETRAADMQERIEQSIREMLSTIPSLTR